MDRNLGATIVAGASNDAESYGDLYQWGRGTDGHQIRTSSLTAGQSSSTTPGSSFLFLAYVPPAGLTNWYSGTNPDNLWQGVSGNVNNPCPSGYRLPTEAEWSTEHTSWNLQNAAGALASPLKLPLAGYRNGYDGTLTSIGTIGYYWSSTVIGTNSRGLFVHSSGIQISQGSRNTALSVRCIKN